MIRGTVRRRSFVVVGALAASLMLGVFTGRLVGSDDPATITTPAPLASDAPTGATPDDRHPAAVDNVRRSASPEDSFATTAAPPAAPATATPIANSIVRFDSSVFPVPTAQPPA